MIIFKNIFSFILTFYAYDWLIFGGIEKTMVAISSVQVVVCALTIPMCKYSHSMTNYMDISNDCDRHLGKTM